MVEDLDTRRRRALYRANHRGTKEMDWMLGRFANAAVADMDPSELSVFEQFIAISDPELQPWLMDTPAQLPVAPPDPAFADLIGRVRAFHGLTALPTAARR
ncbi:MAG: succinate dehydrogenase assembly factor 2 [Pseudomonadota bacterium]